MEKRFNNITKNENNSMDLKKDFKNVGVLLLVIAGTLVFVYILLLMFCQIKFTFPNLSSNDQSYWFFSASAQTLAALVAFLMTGYALVINVLDNTAERDDTWDELLPELKRKYYKQFKILGYVAGAAIGLSLLILWFKEYSFYGKAFVFFAITMLNILTIWLGVNFALSIIDPDKYRKVAAKLVDRDRKEQSFSNDIQPKSIFINRFIDIEKLVRELLSGNDIKFSYGEDFRSFSFRHAITVLFKGELINDNLYGNLLQINKYRNLVFHGHLESVPEDIVKSAEHVYGLLKNIQDKEIKILKFLNKRQSPWELSYVASQVDIPLKEIYILVRNLAEKRFVAMAKVTGFSLGEKDTAAITQEGIMFLDSKRQGEN
jgi:hypothetical protein